MAPLHVARPQAELYPPHQYRPASRMAFINTTIINTTIA